MRISTDGTDEHGGSIAVPGYGTQIQDKSVLGKFKEATVNINYSYQTFTFPDGEAYELRTPVYTLTDLHIPISVPYTLSPRLAPPVFGLGLLENISEMDIIANADLSDSNNDGISGKPNYVWDPVQSKMMLGRFDINRILLLSSHKLPQLTTMTWELRVVSFKMKLHMVSRKRIFWLMIRKYRIVFCMQ